ncbi:MAG: arylesterase, partial [Pseudomonadota bacterium]
MKLLFLRGLITACCLLSLPAWGAQKILVLGDSLSASYGLAQTSGWVSLLQQRLAAEKFPH